MGKSKPTTTRTARTGSAARKALASMEAPVVSERITSVSTNDDGVTTTGIIDANGEEWAVITGWSWKVKD